VPAGGSSTPKFLGHPLWRQLDGKSAVAPGFSCPSFMFCGRTRFFCRRLIFFNAELPCGTQRTRQNVFIGRRQDDVCSPGTAPAAFNGYKNFRQFRHERGLLFRFQQQIPIAQFGGGERSENAAVDPEVRVPHVRAFFRAGHAQGNSPKIIDIHRRYPGQCYNNSGGVAKRRDGYWMHRTTWPWARRQIPRDLGRREAATAVEAERLAIATCQRGMVRFTGC
jgi:hypothetical protein